MTKNLLRILLFIPFLNALGQDLKTTKDTLFHYDEGDKIYLNSQVDSVAKYQPIQSEMYSFFAKNIIYPSKERENGTQGKVLASFIIEKNGTITDIIIIKSLTVACDNEVKRLISLLPNIWTPAYKDGQPVRSQFVLPINFKMNDERKKIRK